MQKHTVECEEQYPSIRESLHRIAEALEETLERDREDRAAEVVNWKAGPDET